MFETVIRGTLSECIAHFDAEEPRGEYTVVIEGAEEKSVNRKEEKYAKKYKGKEEIIR
jgi:16S rRNA C1402 (ribose-2'-O) methylase RsmI